MKEDWEYEDADVQCSRCKVWLYSDDLEGSMCIVCAVRTVGEEE